MANSSEWRRTEDLYVTSQLLAACLPVSVIHSFLPQIIFIGNCAGHLISAFLDLTVQGREWTLLSPTTLTCTDGE